MSELRGRSRRSRKRGSTSLNGSSQTPAASRKRRQSSSYGSGSRNGDGYEGAANRGSQRNGRASLRQRSRRPQESYSRGLVQSSPGAIVKASPRYQARDGRRIPIGPDATRRRRQVGAYAPAFNGRSTHPQHGSPGPEATLAPPLPSRDSSQYFPGAKAAGTSRPVQRLDPRVVRQSSVRKRSAPPRRKLPKPTPPIVYAVRLLILGVGIGAIAGTVISAIEPSDRDAAMTASSEQSVPGHENSIDNTSGGATPPSALALPESGRSLATPLNFGQEMASLLTELQTLAGGYTDLTPGIFVYDLDTTNYLSVNGDNPFSAASTIKVPVLVAFFQDVEAGRIKLDDILTMKENDVATGSGDMQFQPVGTEYTALETATKMIIISDNTATNMLIRKLGGAHALNRRFQSWGLPSTAIRNPLPDLEGTNTTSPRDLVTLMTLVSHGELLSLRSRDQMLHIMERTQTQTLLPQGIGPGAQIAHKTGDIGSMVGDVGLVDMPNGKRYGITVLVQRPHNDSRAQELIRQISSTVYDKLEASEELGSTPTPPASSENGEQDTPLPSSNPEVENPEFFGIQ